MLRLNGKVALAIGLGQKQPAGAAKEWGIGAACAILLARQGATIFGGDRDIAAAARTKRAIEAEAEAEGGGRQCHVVETDATSSRSVKALVDACVARHGRIDVLLCSVGQSQPGSAATMGENVWDAQMDVNLKSAFLACHHALPVMEAQRRPRGGSVVCVSSIAGMRHIGKEQIAYNTAKAALLQFVRATAVSCADKGVRLNAVVPGLVDTPYTKALAERFGVEEGAFRRAREGQVPMGRMGDAWDVASAAVFLAADEARYITGQKIVVDGGMTSSTGRA